MAADRAIIVAKLPMIEFKEAWLDDIIRTLDELGISSVQSVEATQKPAPKGSRDQTPRYMVRLTDDKGTTFDLSLSHEGHCPSIMKVEDGEGTLVLDVHPRYGDIL